MSSSGKYIDLWNKKRESIKEKLKFSETKQSLQLDASELMFFDVY
jgi:hypothetical protein